MAKNDRDIAIVVGINNYPASIGPLQGAVNDAQNFINWLIDENGGNLPPENVHLIPETADLNALDIQAKIEDIVLEKSEDMDEQVGRRLYLFFSGHGVSHDSEEAWLLLPRATSANYHFHSVAGKESAKAFVDSALFKEVVLVMDCCRNQLQWPQIPPQALFNLPKHPGSPTIHCYAFAAAWGEKAIEAELDSAPETNGFNGLFTTSLLAGLRGEAEPDQDGNITARALGDFIKKRLPELAAEHKVLAQTPRVLAPDGEKIIFVSGLQPAPAGQKTIVEVTLPLGSSNRQWKAGKPEALPIAEEEISETVFRYRLEPERIYEFVYLTANGQVVETFQKIPPKPAEEVHHVSA